MSGGGLGSDLGLVRPVHRLLARARTDGSFWGCDIRGGGPGGLSTGAAAPAEATAGLGSSGPAQDIGAEHRARQLLAVENLSTHFRAAAGDVKALDGVSLSLSEGRTLGVVGESGSGKTVLIRSIMGLLPPDKVTRSGRVLVAGRDLAVLNDRELRGVWGAEIGMVFQDPMSSLSTAVRPCLVSINGSAGYPYIGTIEEGLTVVTEGEDGVSMSDEAGRLAARLVLDGRWTDTLPAEPFAPRFL
jgi:ABC transporter family protein